MNIFVTGGSGFVGSHLIQQLIKSNHKVWALARSEQAEKKVSQSGASPVKGSLADIPRWAGALSHCEIVIHCASTIEHWGPWSFFENEIVSPTEELLSTADQHSVKRFIYISSDSVLHNSINLLNIDETTPYPAKNNSLYGKAKQLAEKSILAYKGNIETIILRPPYIWGSDSPLFLDICQRARRNQFPWIENGNAEFEQVHIDNLVQAILLALTAGHSGAIYYVTDGHPMTLREFFSAAFVQLGITLPPFSVPGWIASAGVTLMEWVCAPFPIKPPLARYELAFLTQPRRYRIEKAVQELGYKPANFATLLQSLRH